MEAVVLVLVPEEEILREELPRGLLFLACQGYPVELEQRVPPHVLRERAFRVHLPPSLHRKDLKSSTSPDVFVSDAWRGVYSSFAASPIRSIVSCIFTVAPGK